MSDDLIRRSDAIKALNREKSDWNCDYNVPIDNCIKRLNKVKSADRPQGKWIRDRYWSRGIGMGEEYGFFYKCSLCEYEVENGYTRCGFNFCPYCGARMKGE